MIHLSLQTSFSCAHFYKQSKWDDQTNLQKFGKCFSNHGHGHDYRLKVTIAADVNHIKKNEEQLTLALKKLRDDLDHKHLNLEFSEFQDQIPTTENLIQFCFEKLQKSSALQFKKLELFETDTIFAAIDL